MVYKVINKELLLKRFNKSAKEYDKYANVQKKMAHHLLDNLNFDNNMLNKEISILEIGCGTGYLTQLLVELFPTAHITVVDIASDMLEITKDKVGQKNIAFICGDIEEIEINKKFDLIISNATFQWLNHLDKTIKKLYMSLNKKGIICISTFGKHTFSELHFSFQKAKQQLHLDIKSSPGQSFYSLYEIKDLCQSSIPLHNKPTEITEKEGFEYEYFTSVKDFFESIKKIGANNSNQKKYFMPPALLKKLIKIYETEFTVNDKIKVTYHCLFLTIKKQ